MKKQFETAPSGDLFEGLPEGGQENMVSLFEDIGRTKKNLEEIEKKFEAFAKALLEFSVKEQNNEEYIIIRNEMLKAHGQIVSLGETLTELHVKLEEKIKRNQKGKQPHYEN